MGISKILIISKLTVPQPTQRGLMVWCNALNWFNRLMAVTMHLFRVSIPPSSRPSASSPVRLIPLIPCCKSECGDFFPELRRRQCIKEASFPPREMAWASPLLSSCHCPIVLPPSLLASACGLERSRTLVYS